jgi:hypothetical protein
MESEIQEGRVRGGAWQFAADFETLRKICSLMSLPLEKSGHNFKNSSKMRPDLTLDHSIF